MEKSNPVKELEVLAELSRLAQIIEENNWEHLYAKVNTPMTSAIVRQQRENNDLQKLLFEARTENIKLKSMVNVTVKHLSGELASILDMNSGIVTLKPAQLTID